jgi:hypothetical protein
MDYCPLFFFDANEKWTVQVYDVKIMAGMDFQGHICSTTVGDKVDHTHRIMPNQQYNQLHNMYRTYIADNF